MFAMVFNLSALPVAYAQDDVDVPGGGIEEIEEIEEECTDGEACFIDKLDALSDNTGDSGDSSEASVKKAREAEELVADTVKLANKTHRIFAPLINFFSFQIGNFLGHDYLYVGSMGKMLKKIWVISRNLVNIAFVFVLLWLAVSEIFSVTKESELKTKLPIFVLLLIAVNFSWLGTKVVLDASNVAAHTMFAIPSGLANDPLTKGTEYNSCEVNTDPEVGSTGMCYPSTIIAPTTSGLNPPLYWKGEPDEDGGVSDCDRAKEGYNILYNDDGSEKANVSADDEEKYGNLKKRTSICVENLNLVDYNQNTAVIYLTYGMARIQNLVHSNANTDITQLSVGILMSLVIQLAYSVTLLSLFLALVVRMMMLWLFVAFSPFLVLLYYFKESSSAQEISGKFDFGAFISWAFAPAKVGAVFAVTFIMISAGQAGGEQTMKFLDSVGTSGTSVYRILNSESLFMGIGSLQSLIWLIMSLAVLWMGVFAILTKLEVVGGVFERIKGYGTETAKKVAALPYVAPILPLGANGEDKSIKSMVGGVDVLSKLNDKYYGGERRPDAAALESRAASRGNWQEIEKHLDKGKGEELARHLGFRNQKQMVDMDTDTLTAILSKVKGTAASGKSDKEIATAIKALKNEKTAEQISREGSRLAKSVEEGTAAAQAKLPGGVNPAGTPGATPKPSAGGPATPTPKPPAPPTT